MGWAADPSSACGVEPVPQAAAAAADDIAAANQNRWYLIVVFLNVNVAEIDAPVRARETSASITHHSEWTSARTPIIRRDIVGDKLFQNCAENSVTFVL
jgi:hypothetical protein